VGTMELAEQIQHLIRLHRKDEAIRALQQQIAAYPERVRRLQQQIQTLRRREEEAHQAFRIARQQREERELYVSKLEQQIENLQSMARQAKSNREYSEILLQIDDVRNRIRQAEDELLRVMEQEERAQEEWHRMKQETERAIRDLEQQIAHVQSEQRILEQRLQAWIEERDALRATIPSKVLAQYDRIAHNRSGIALAEVQDGTCGACHIQLRPRVYQSLLMMEDMVFCESCQRILFLPEWEEASALSSPSPG